ncbi:hypothetical protein D7W79_03700 [Corallococcus exercitus]|uniref:hypothetical protein n=1 Tax=Corallococcus exercitus TaxID=2316736 RepID=UPI000EA35FEA|nr:hypothetical protein [Corallococcus exercitus]RKG82047.1 hypothetical protein D7W79_03700 [Corallococcus exercitus]
MDQKTEISFELSSEEQKAINANKSKKITVTGGTRMQTGVRAGPVDEGCIFFARNAPFAA